MGRDFYAVRARLAIAFAKMSLPVVLSGRLRAAVITDFSRETPTGEVDYAKIVTSFCFPRNVLCYLINRS